MLNVTLSELGSVDEKEYSRVIIAARYNGKWILSKHKDRGTWEIPGGHVEPGEDWLTTAKRELYEETGATDAEYEPICVYKVSVPGLLCYAEVKSLGQIPNFEMEKIDFFDELPENLTYPDIHKVLFDRAVEFLKSKEK